MDTYP